MCKRQLPNILIMKDFDLKKYLAENKLLKEDDLRVSSINIGDKFQDGDTDIWTVKDIFIPEWTTEVETITLENEDGESTIWPDDFDGGGFFEWFNLIESEEGGNIYEDSLKESDSFMIPSGWTDGGDDYSDWENNPGETVIKVFSAPMEGWDKEHEDIIMIKKGIGDFNPDNEEKFFVDGYISYGDYGTPDGPFDSYDDAFKVAVEAMEELKQDWK